MNHEDILALREFSDKDKAIVLIKEGIAVLENELAPVLSDIENKNKAMYVDLLIYRMGMLNDLLSYSIKYLTENFTRESTLEQAMLEGNIIKNIEEIKI